MKAVRPLAARLAPDLCDLAYLNPGEGEALTGVRQELWLLVSWTEAFVRQHVLRILLLVNSNLFGGPVPAPAVEVEGDGMNTPALAARCLPGSREKSPFHLSAHAISVVTDVEFAGLARDTDFQLCPSP